MLNGVDITRKVDKVQTKFEADNICGEVDISIADRTILDGVVQPRLPRELAIEVSALGGGGWVSRGAFYLEEILHPPNRNARTSTIWGRSLGARLAKPWGQKISRQWAAATTISAILQELGEMCGVTISVQNDFAVCQYCYAVSDWYPSQIVQDLAEKSGQVCWPQVDGSLVIAPRLYRDLPAPAAVLVANQVDVQSVRRRVPDFGNRILISGDVAVAGISIQVVTLYDEDQCVAADGQSQVRLVAVALGTDGAPVASGTAVTWSCTGGRMVTPTSETGSTMVVGEQHRADGYRQVTLDLPASSVVGVYAYGDVRKATNLYTLLGGSVSGRTITFAASLPHFDEAVVVDYVVAGAEATWEAGWTPGDVTVYAAVAGAQGSTTIHQSNPSACASSIVLEASPSDPCLGDVVAILAKVTMWGGPGIGPITARLDGCGTMTSTRKTLGTHQITETLRTTQWGGVSQVRLSAIPATGTTPSVVLTETPGADLYLAHDRQTLMLSEALLPGTQVTATYMAAGTALFGWKSAAVPSGTESIHEFLPVAHAEVEGVTVAQVTLSRIPVAAPLCVPIMELSDFYASHASNTVTLLEDDGVILPVGTSVECTYQSAWLTQPGCSGVITVTVQDGSQDGGTGTITVAARDCRDVVGPEDYDPDDPNQVPEGDGSPNESGEDDPTSWLQPEVENVTPNGCGPGSINARTPAINPQNAREVFGVPAVENCPGVCTCDEICTALRSSGRLATEGGMTYSTCISACNEARYSVCEPCELTGPTTLEPGEEGTWVDGKTNSGEWSGQLALKSRTFGGGYVATMPNGGVGPFVVKVCYGEDARTCCEAQVDFPPCSLTGPSELAAMQEGEFEPSLGMSEAEAVVQDMVVVRKTADAFIARLRSGACDGSIAVYYGGRMCGYQEVIDSYSELAGVVTGDPLLEPGETGYFTHNLGPGATYTGELEVISMSEDGTSAVLMMPASAQYGYTKEVSWAGRCGVTASMTVSVLPECAYTYDRVQRYRGGNGVGTPPSWVGARVLIIDDSGGSLPHKVVTVSAIDPVANNYLAYCVGKTIGAWSIVFVSGAGYVFAECTAPDGSGYWHTANGWSGYC